MISPETLRRYPYFAGLSDETLKQIAMIAEEKSVPVGTSMFCEGDVVSALAVIVSGQVDIQYMLGSAGRPWWTRTNARPTGRRASPRRWSPSPPPSFAGCAKPIRSWATG
jgi:hypothetical protein